MTNKEIVRMAIPNAYVCCFHDQDGDWFRVGGTKNRFDYWFGAKDITTEEEARKSAR